jgi:hypothetical protein
VLGVLLVAGAAVLVIAHPDPVRAAVCWTGGLGLSVVALEVSIGNVRYTDRWLPKLTVAVALFSYLMVVVLLGLVLAASHPDVVVPGAVAAGLVAGMLVEVGYLMGAAWARSDHPSDPVTLSSHDDHPTQSAPGDTGR